MKNNMKHDEGMIEEILKEHVFDGIEWYLGDIEERIDKAMKQYAEHMIKADRERIVTIIHTTPTVDNAGKPFSIPMSYEDEIIRKINQ